MKQFDILKKSLVAASLLCSAGVVNAQVHPLAFGSQTIGGAATPTNWYADYVGVRFEVVSPASVAGDKIYKTTNDGDPTNASNWGAAVPPTIIDKPIAMPQPGDSLAGSAISVNMTGKVGMVYRGGGIEFGAKALACQNANALACIIVNNISGGPVGMGAGAVGSAVTIPVFMISKEDGDALDVLYNNAIIANVTITNWGQGFSNDLGFVPGGLANWHNFAVPSNQLTGTMPVAYRNVDGAFIANYGNNPATNVKLATDLKFTPTGGAASSIHTSTTGNLASFTVADSIYAMFVNTEYDLPVATSTGRYDLMYTITSDSTDDFAYDNTTTSTFYATDSLYSKGRYDFTTNQPIRTISYSFNGGNEYIWGPMYYVNNAGSSVSRLQYSIAMSVTPGGSTILGGQNSVYLFKWVDGYDDVENGVTYPKDSVMETGELILVSLGIKVYDGVNDTSGALLELTTMGDTDGNAHQVALEANSWYYLGVDVPSSTSTQLFLGSDGIQSAYPRIYGRFHAADGLLDYNSVVQPGDRIAMYGNYQFGNTPNPVTATNFIASVDSFNFNNAKGVVPAVAMYVKPTVADAVKTVSKPIADVVLFPNPATDLLNVTLSVEKTANAVSYEVIDGLGRFVSKETHNNVKNDKAAIDTRNFAPGTYYLIITVDNKIMSRKFTIAK